MRLLIIIFCLLFLSYLNHTTFAQDISVHNLIGVKQEDVVKIYGKPVHIDNTSPLMICLFYKAPNMVVVLDDSGVYQAEITKVYSSEQERKEDLDKLILSSRNSGFRSDTLSVTKILLSKEGVQSNIELVKGPNSSDYELKIKTNRHSE